MLWDREERRDGRAKGQHSTKRDEETGKIIREGAEKINENDVIRKAAEKMSAKDKR